MPCAAPVTITERSARLLAIVIAARPQYLDGLSDELRGHVPADRLGTALGAVARVLDSPERCLWHADAVMVDRNHAALDIGGDRLSRPQAARVGIGGEPIG